MAMILAVASAATAAFMGYSLLGVILAYTLGGSLGMLVLVVTAAFSSANDAKSDAISPIVGRSGNTVGS